MLFLLKQSLKKQTEHTGQKPSLIDSAEMDLNHSEI